MKSFAVLATALGALSLTLAATPAANNGVDAVARQRMARELKAKPHHAHKRHRRHRRRSVVAKCDADGTDQGSGVYASAAISGNAPQVTSSPSNNNGSSYTSTSIYPAKAVSVNNVFFGMLPDGGTDGGARDSMATLNKLITNTGGVHATYGQYAQARSGTTFDGSQLLQVMDDLKASGAIFEPAVMPTGGWQGLTSKDNSQAVNICKVMKKFTDEGISVRLRFAHECNYYITDGTYSGTAADCVEGFVTVATACKTIAPEVKMFWTPNVANLAQYDQFMPKDLSLIHFLGIDYYPHQADINTGFLDAMKGFHDKYASPNTLFAIGETGLGYSGSAADKLTWIKSIAAAKSNGMQYLESVAWFNYQKGYNFKICDPNDSSTTGSYVGFLKQS